MNENQAERLVVAFEKLATVGQAFYDKLYPKRERKDAILTRIKTDEELLRESQGDTGEPLEEWLGPREKELAKEGS